MQVRVAKTFAQSLLRNGLVTTAMKHLLKATPATGPNEVEYKAGSIVQIDAQQASHMRPCGSSVHLCLGQLCWGASQDRVQPQLDHRDSAESLL